MTDTPDSPAVEATEPVEATQPSILSELRKARDKIGVGADPLRLPVPGYNGLLVVSYKWVPYSRLSATAKSLGKIKDQLEQQVAAAADTLVATCDEILINDAGELHSFSPAPVTFADSEALAEALGFPKADSSRQTCYSVFNNEYAMIDAAFKVSSWLEDTSKQVDEEFLGES
jgi:hypothetical protein